MPTGVALRDPREQLFAAAERVLLRDGVAGLTGRAVTAEAGVAKGVLHRHFPDFDAFLTELVLSRIARIDARSGALTEAAGTGSVVGNLSAALADVFTPVAIAAVGLVISRDELRTALRAAGTARFPVLGEATALVASYLSAEQALGRVGARADVATIAPMLIGAAHLHFTDADSAPGVEKIVTAALADLV